MPRSSNNGILNSIPSKYYGNPNRAATALSYNPIMAVLYSEPPAGALPVEPLPHKTWTREELALVESTGVFEGTHYELIEGELIDKRGKKHPHVLATGETVDVLKAIFGAKYVIQEASIDVSAEDNARNEPEPDVVVLRRTLREIGANPGPADILLLVEVACASLGQDLSTKAKLYARAGIPEYWVLDVNKRRLHVHRDPTSGLYRTRYEIEGGGAVEPQAKLGQKILLADLLP